MNDQPFMLVRLSGADAVDFLQGQITQDLKSLAPDQARWGAYCTAKGRVLANFLVLRPTGDPWLIVPHDVAEAFVKRLKMFVLRAKVSIEIAADCVLHLCAASQPEALQVQERDSAWVIGMPGARAIVIAPSEQASVLDTYMPVAWADWQESDILHGLPWVHASTADTFIPQTLNLDLLGGINFEKGCYPGQEVVARSHYLGKLKRRMFAGRTEIGAAQAGMDIFAAQESAEPCGRVVNASPSGAVLFELNLAAQGHALYLGAPDGPSIEPIALPYA